MSFLGNLILEFCEKNILVVDFDTQFTNMRGSIYRGSKLMKLEETEVFLPYEIAFEKVVDKFMDYDEPDCVLVIDSLNGLIDYFGSYEYGYDDGINSYQKRASKKETNMENTKNAGYKGLCLLKILLQSHCMHNVPIVLTSYISQRGLDKLIADLLVLEEGLMTDRNHFRRFSNSISCLGSHQFNSNFFVTILKKKQSSMTLSSSSHRKVYPHSIIIKDILG
jgi:hypothetical protein